VRYQLVVQLPSDGVADLDTLTALEDELIDALGSIAEADGHDIGAGEGNIFVHTDDPAETFVHVRELLVRKGLLAAARVANRELEGEKYTVLWPEHFNGDFAIL
jgi:hypothetical protein